MKSIPTVSSVSSLWENVFCFQSELVSDGKPLLKTGYTKGNNITPMDQGKVFLVYRKANCWLKNDADLVKLAKSIPSVSSLWETTSENDSL